MNDKTRILVENISGSGMACMVNCGMHEGLDWISVKVMVTGGALSMMGDSVGTWDFYAGLAGFQLRAVLEDPALLGHQRPPVTINLFAPESDGQFASELEAGGAVLGRYDPELGIKDTGFWMESAMDFFDDASAYGGSLARLVLRSLMSLLGAKGDTLRPAGPSV